MSYYRTLGAIDAHDHEGGSGASGGGAAAGPRRVGAIAITGHLPMRRPRGFEPRPAFPIAMSTMPIAPAPRRPAGRPPGFEPRPAFPVALPTTPDAPAPPRSAGGAPKPAFSSYGGGGGGGGGTAATKSGATIAIDELDLEPDAAPAAPAAPKSKLGLYVLLGAGALVGYKLLRRRK